MSKGKVCRREYEGCEANLKLVTWSAQGHIGAGERATTARSSLA